MSSVKWWLYRIFLANKAEKNKKKLVYPRVIHLSRLAIQETGAHVINPLKLESYANIQDFGIDKKYLFFE